MPIHAMVMDGCLQPGDDGKTTLIMDGFEPQTDGVFNTKTQNHEVFNTKTVNIDSLKIDRDGSQPPLFDAIPVCLVNGKVLIALYLPAFRQGKLGESILGWVDSVFLRLKLRC